MGERTVEAATTWRRQRLEQLLNLALAYKDWTRKELALRLGRDPTKLVPGTGIPKLDLVVQLASVIDWPVGDVVSHLWTPLPAADDNGRPTDFKGLERSAARALRSGRYGVVIDLARAAAAAACTPRQRAAAYYREATGWERLGRYADVVHAISHGMLEKGLPPRDRRRLQSMLAGAYYALWSLVESHSISRQILDGYRDDPPRTRADQLMQARARALSGQAHRRLLSIEPRRAGELAASARHDLEQAESLYRALAADLDDPSYEARADTCRGGLIEVDVALGRRRPSDALTEISVALDGLKVSTDAGPPGRLESLGWWCIYGCNIALRHLSDERELQQQMAVLTNLADDIANATDSWPLRERVFSMQYTRWERVAGCTGFEIPCVIDSDEVRVITGTMGRFPTFRRTGWRILKTAKILE